MQVLSSKTRVHKRLDISKEIPIAESQVETLTILVVVVTS